MGSWPWPLSEVENWFYGLWNWVGKAAVDAVSEVSGWIWGAVRWVGDNIRSALSGVWNSIAGAINWVWSGISGAVSGLWAQISGWFNQLWGWIRDGLGSTWLAVSRALNGLWNQISGWFNQLWGWIRDGLGATWNAVSGAVTGLWNQISGWFNQLWGWIRDGLGSTWNAVSGAVSGLWGNITGFLTRFWNDVSGGLGAIGDAITGGFGGFTDLIGGLLSGLATAFGTAFQQAITGLTSTLTVVVPEVLKFINQNIIQPAVGALRWILDFVSGLFRDFYDSFVSTLRGIGFGTPEGAAVLAIPLLLTSISAVFVMGSLGSVGDIKIMGCGIQLSSLTNQLIAAFGITQLSSAVISPILSAAYGQPVRYYWNSVFRPYIVSTGQADQMFFEEHISEGEWRQVYAYQGWKDRDIDAWSKTMWREPSLLVLRNLVLDPDTDLAWIRKKMRENGLIGEDADAMIAYGQRAALKDERTALASQVEKDVVEGVESAQEARGDLAILKFTEREIEYRIAKMQFIIDRAERAAAAKAAGKKPPARKGVSESDLDLELQLGLISPALYVQNLQVLEYSEDAAERKYRLLVTPRPVSAVELSRRRLLAESQVAKTKRRYELVLSRQDQQAASISVAIESTQAEFAAALAVVDMEVAAIRSELAGITPDVLAEPLRKQIAATKRRYERALALLDHRETRLVEDVAATQTLAAETLDVVDVEAAFIKAELEELGVVT